MNTAESLSRRLTTCVLIVLPFLYFYPAVTGQALLAPLDGWTQNYPLRVLVGELLTRGELPLWNPFIYAGMPLLATVYPGAAYPPNWLFALLPAGVAMNLVVITTYHLALFGAYRLGRAFGWRRDASLCLAVSFAFSAFMVGHLAQTSRIAAAAWLPWTILVVERLARGVTRRWVTVGILCTGLQMLAGEPQMWLNTALLATAYTLWRALQIEAPARRRLLFACAFVWFGGLCLSAVQWLPAWELARFGDRAAPTYEFFTSYALPPRQLAALWLPFFAGGASIGPYRMPWVYWGEWNAVVVCGYVGMLAWLLAFVAIGRQPVAVGVFPARSFVRFWMVIAVVSLALALGDNLPGGLQHLLFRVPGYNIFRGPYRHQLEFVFALAVLAGYGWQRLEMTTAELRRQLLRKAAGLLALIVTAAALAYVWLTPRLFPAALAVAFTDANVTVPLACSLGAIIAAYWHWGTDTSPKLLTSLALLGWLALDLAFYGHFFYWRDTSYAWTAKGGDTALTQFIKARESAAHDYRTVTQYRESAEPNRELLNYPNTSLLRGVQNVNGFDTLRLTRLEHLIEPDGSGLRHADSIFAPAHCGLDLLNAKYLIFDSSPAERTKPAPQRWKPLAHYGALTLYENLRAMPRAWLVSEARTFASADVLRTLQTGVFPDGGAFDPRQTALFTRRELPQLPASQTDKTIERESVAVTRYAANVLELQVETPQARWLILSEIDYPGWEARLDGEPVASYRADYLLRSVAIPAGRHRVEFRYRPTSALVGLLLSLGTLAALGLSYWRGRLSLKRPR